MSQKIKVTLVRSKIGIGKKQKSCLVGLGLRKIRSSRVLENTASVRGMIEKIKHLVTIKIVSSSEEEHVSS